MIENEIMECTKKETKKKMSISHYILMMLSFSLPILVVGSFVMKEDSNMIMPVMFILGFGMASINAHVKG